MLKNFIKMFNVIKDGQHTYGDLCYVSNDVSMWNAALQNEFIR
jgi:hypothetical protein